MLKNRQALEHLYHVFIDFKKTFNRVWHAALWATMKKYNINANRIQPLSYHVPFCQTDYKKCFFCPDTVTDWYNLPKDEATAPIFKPFQSCSS